MFPVQIFNDMPIFDMILICLCMLVIHYKLCIVAQVNMFVAMLIVLTVQKIAIKAFIKFSFTIFHYCSYRPPV